LHSWRNFIARKLNGEGIEVPATLEGGRKGRLKKNKLRRMLDWVDRALRRSMLQMAAKPRLLASPAERPIHLAGLREKVSRGIKARSREVNPCAKIDSHTMPTAPPISRDPTLDAHVFWWKFRAEIIAVLIIGLLALAGFGGYRFYVERRASAAAEALAEAKTIPDYEKVIAAYANTPAGASAYIFVAEAQRNEKKFAEANATLKSFIDKNPTHDFVATAEMAIAANLESMGKSDEALATYQQIAAKYPKNFNAPMALMSQVSLLKIKNRTDEARRACERVLTDYKDSIWAREAARQYRLLKPTTPEIPRGTIPPMLAAPSAAPAGPPRPNMTPPAQPKPNAPPNKPRN
jgi:predicted negative regulator of RcsB-dependent stress response